MIFVNKCPNAMSCQLTVFAPPFSKDSSESAIVAPGNVKLRECSLTAAAVCREVSNILSRGQPPPEPDERHKWTHPSPVTAATSRPLSCPLYPATPRQETVLLH